MKIEDQICSLEQAKKLKELGVSFENSLYVFVDNLALKKVEGIKVSKETGSYKHFRKIKDAMWIKFYSAFTVAELGVMLDSAASTELDLHNNWRAYPPRYVDSDYYMPLDFRCNTEAECRAEALIQLIENDTLSIDKINQRLTD